MQQDRPTFGLETALQGSSEATKRDEIGRQDRHNMSERSDRNDLTIISRIIAKLLLDPYRVSVEVRCSRPRCEINIIRIVVTVVTCVTCIKSRSAIAVLECAFTYIAN